MQDQMYQRNLGDDRRKDELWKETQKKQAELDDRKKQSDIWEALKYKDLKK